MENPELKNIQDKALFAELLRRYKCMARPFGSAAILAGDARNLRSFSDDLAELNCWCIIDPNDFSGTNEGSGSRDDLIVQKVLERIKEPACNHGAIFNGFPQNLHQAQKFERGLGQVKVRMDRVIEVAAKGKEELAKGLGQEGQGKNGFREVIEFYKTQGRVVTMDGDKSKEYISSQMKSLFSKGLYNKFD